MTAEKDYVSPIKCPECGTEVVPHQTDATLWELAHSMTMKFIDSLPPSSIPIKLKEETITELITTRYNALKADEREVYRQKRLDDRIALEIVTKKSSRKPKKKEVEDDGIVTSREEQSKGQPF